MSNDDTRQDKVGARDAQRREMMMERITALLWEGHSLRAIAAMAQMPSFGTLQRWLTDDRAFRVAYQRIRWAQRNIMIDEVLALAGDPHNERTVGRIQRAARAWRTALKAQVLEREADQERQRIADDRRARERTLAEMERQRGDGRVH